MSSTRYHDITIDREALESFCRRWKVRRLSLFGSILRADFRPDSDIDVLVEFIPAAHTTLFDVANMELELSAELGRKVDLRTPQDLSKYFRDAVLAEAQLQYAA